MKVVAIDDRAHSAPFTLMQLNATDFARRHIRDVVWIVPENVMELSWRGLDLYISLYFAAQIVGCDHCVFGQKVNLNVLANFNCEFD